MRAPFLLVEFTSEMASKRAELRNIVLYGDSIFIEALKHEFLRMAYKRKKNNHGSLFDTYFMEESLRLSATRLSEKRVGDDLILSSLRIS